MKSKLTQKEQQKIKYFFYKCKLKYLISSNIWCIAKITVFIGIFSNLIGMTFNSPISMVVTIVIHSFEYLVALLIMKFYLFIASKRYNSLEVGRISHKISGSFVEKKHQRLSLHIKMILKKFETTI